MKAAIKYLVFIVAYDYTTGEEARHLVGETWAKSEEQAINNIQYRTFMGTGFNIILDKDRGEYFEAVPAINVYSMTKI